MGDPIDVLLLFALPASGKSEVRKYLGQIPPERRRAEFHLADPVQIDDFPYVHAMRSVDAALAGMGEPALFFHAPDRSFIDPWDWGTLTRLVDADWRELASPPTAPDDDAAGAPALWLFERIDEAALRAGARIKLSVLRPEVREALAERLAPLAAELAHERRQRLAGSTLGRTVIIEFARGGPHGARPPIEAPSGYAYALSQLSPELLERAAILYVWVTPEESRRKNEERADPADPGSILHHGVPLEVMLGEYGCDDIEWLLETSDRPDTVRIEAHGRTFYLPLARFDNRVDGTSFVRGPRDDWPEAAVAALHAALKDALDRIAALRCA